MYGRCVNIRVYACVCHVYIRFLLVKLHVCQQMTDILKLVQLVFGARSGKVAYVVGMMAVCSSVMSWVCAVSLTHCMRRSCYFRRGLECSIITEKESLRRHPRANSPFLLFFYHSDPILLDGREVSTQLYFVNERS